MIAHLSASDIADLRRSGLSDTMIASMQLESLDRNALTLRLERNDFDSDESGYAIPYFDMEGRLIRSFNCRLHKGIPRSDSSSGKRMKYCKPMKTDNLVYFPPGFHALYEQHKYVLITEGEKKAAKAVQEGFPCVAIGGVWNWFENSERNREKLEGLKVSYKTRPLDALLAMAMEKKIILLFDSDAAENEQVRAALRSLSDSLLYYSNGWVRGSWVPVNTPANAKMGIDDLLCAPSGTVDLQRLLDEELTKPSNGLTPLMRFVYHKTSDGRKLYYVVPNTPRGAKTNVHQVIKQVEATDGDNAGTIVSKVVGTTRVWMHRVVHSIDDDTTMYNMAYVPLSSNEVKYLSGGSELISLSGRSGGDVYSDRGAPILGKERAAMEEFFHACLGQGVRQQVVKQVDGTRRRGWIEHDKELMYLLPNRVYTRNLTYAAAARDVPLLPIEGSAGDGTVNEAMRPKGDLAVWRQAMLMGVLPNTTPLLFVAAGLAGLLRHWCPDSENFIVHLYNDSSSGKTTALKAAAGLWGNPAKVIDMWRTTDNGLEGRCVARNDMALFLDEAGMVSNDDIIKNAVYMIGNGGEKLRASRDGTERKARTFRLVTLSTGERTLLRGERQAGQEVRALEIPTHVTGSFWEKSIHGSAEAERLSVLLSENYGFAADLAIRAILDSERDMPGVWKNTHHLYTEALRKSLPAGTPPHIMRRAKHYGLILVALTVFLKGPMGFSVADAMTYVNQVRWDISKHMLLMATDQFTGGEAQGMLEHFLASLVENESHFYTHESPRGDVWGSFLFKDSTVDIANIMPSAFNLMAKPYDGSRILDALQKAGALVYNSGRRDRKTSVRIHNHVTSCYQVQVGAVRRQLNAMLNDPQMAKAERALNGLPIDDLPELKFDDLPLAALRANATKGTEGTGTNEGGAV